jgi:hypothetical protein
MIGTIILMFLVCAIGVTLTIKAFIYFFKE